MGKLLLAAAHRGPFGLLMWRTARRAVRPVRPGAEDRPSLSRPCRPTTPHQWLGKIIFVLANPRSACVHLITDSNIPGARTGPLLSAGGICCNRQPFPARARLSVGGVVSSS